MLQALQFQRSTVLSLSGKTHLRFFARAGQTLSHIGIQASAYDWTENIPSI